MEVKWRVNAHGRAEGAVEEIGKDHADRPHLENWIKQRFVEQPNGQPIDLAEPGEKSNEKKLTGDRATNE